MPYFIAVMPPTDYAGRITEFASRWGYHPDWPPHITIKAQGGLTEDRAWLDAVAKACCSFQPFPVSLAEPAMFGESVLFLQVQSRAIGELHKTLVDTVNPTLEERARYFEDERFLPHLTLGQVEQELTKEQLAEMREYVAVDLTPYATFMVDKLRVFQLDVKGVYQPLLDLPLRGNA